MVPLELPAEERSGRGQRVPRLRFVCTLFDVMALGVVVAVAGVVGAAQIARYSKN